MATLMITLAETPSHKANVRFVQGDDARSTVVEASGLAMSPAIVTETAEWIALQWQSVLSVSVVSENLASAVVVPPMIGRYAIDGDLLRFSPQFPLQPGLTYKAHLDPSAWPDTDGDIVLERHDVPERAPTAPTTVTEIFPTAAELPEKWSDIEINGGRGGGRRLPQLALGFMPKIGSNNHKFVKIQAMEVER